MLSIVNLTTHVADNSATDKPTEILRNISIDFAPSEIYAIMGPNGSGKSTLARAIAGDPTFAIADDSIIKLDGKTITNWSAEKRAAAGIFLSFQSPPEISGVTVRDLMRAACSGGKRSALEIKKQLEQYAQELKIDKDLLSRSLNEGFSGGQRKKMEVLQMALLDPQYIILDEIDTGVDVDALITITQFLRKFIANTNKTLILITHYNRILTHLRPSTVIVITDGTITTTGDASLANQISEEGFGDTNTK